MRTALYFLLIAALLPVQEVMGDELRLTPSVSLREVYNDNILLSADDVKSDFITHLSPGIELAKRSERLDAGILLRIDGILYARNDELNAVDQDYSGRLRFMLNPLTSLSLGAGYTVDSQPDRDTDVTGLVLGSVKRHRQLYSFSGERSLTEKTSVSLAYSYGDDDFDNPEFSDVTSHTGQLGIFYDLGKYIRETRASINFGYAHYDSSASLVNLGDLPSNSKVDNYTATVGITHGLNEVWSIQASVGGRYTVSEFDTWVPVVFMGRPYAAHMETTTRDWGAVGQLGLSYRGETGTANLAFSSDVKPASGQTSGTTVRTGLTADMRRRFTYELSGGLSVGYFLNKSNPGAFSGQEIDDETILVSPNVRYEFNRDMFIEASYQYTKVFHNTTHDDADRNLFFVRFYIQHPWFF